MMASLLRQLQCLSRATSIDLTVASAAVEALLVDASRPPGQWDELMAALPTLPDATCRLALLAVAHHAGIGGVGGMAAHAASCWRPAFDRDALALHALAALLCLEEPDVAAPLLVPLPAVCPVALELAPSAWSVRVVALLVPAWLDRARRSPSDASALIGALAACFAVSCDRLTECVLGGALGPRESVSLLCRLSAHMTSAQWALLLAEPAWWRWIYTRVRGLVERSVDRGADARSLWYVLGAAVEQCARAPAAVGPACAPWMRWAGATTERDWYTWICGFEALDDGFHLIESTLPPAMTSLAAHAALPPLWMQMLLEHALRHPDHHVGRLALLAVCQLPLDHLTWWIDSAFLFGDLMVALLRPALFRGTGAGPCGLLEQVGHWLRVLLAHLPDHSAFSMAPLQHRELGVATLFLAAMADAGRAWIASSLQVADVLLAARSYDAPALGWSLCARCLCTDARLDAEALHGLLRTHGDDLVLGCPSASHDHVRKVLARAPLPTECDDPTLAWFVWAAAAGAPAAEVMDRYPTAKERVLRALVSHADGGLVAVRRHFGGALHCSPSAGPYEWLLADAAAPLDWPSRMAEPLWHDWVMVALIRSPLEGPAAESALGRLFSLPNDHAVDKWRCLARLAASGTEESASFRNSIVEHAQSALSNTATELEQPALLELVLSVGALPLADAALTHWYHVIMGGAGGLSCMVAWARWALASPLRASTVLEELLRLEDKKPERFRGLVACVVEQHLMPLWQRGLVEAPHVVSLITSATASPDARALAAQCLRQWAPKHSVKPALQMLLLRFISRTLADAPAHVRGFQNGPSNLACVRALQGLCCLLPDPDAPPSQEVLDIMRAIFTEQQVLSSSAFFFEVFWAPLVIQLPPLILSFLVPLVSSFNSKRISVGLVALGAAYAVFANPTLDVQLGVQLLRALLPLTVAQAASVRSRAMYVAERAYNHAPLAHELRAHHPDLMGALEMQMAALRAHHELAAKVAEVEGKWLDTFVCRAPLSLESIFVELPSLIPDIVATSISSDTLRSRGIPVGMTAALQESAKQLHSQQQLQLPQQDPAAPESQQRKRVPWHLLLQDESEWRQASIVADAGFVLCASLVEKAPNLGGLCRTVEVLGLGAIVLPSLSVMSSREFQGLSMTSERWVHASAVAPTALVEWLTQQQRQGFSVVALEQCDGSVTLADFVFPPKCVLVLGNEGKGVAPAVLAMCDASVEIPQHGNVRSLNVHVSAAIVMHAYVEQRRSRNAKAE